MSAPARLRSSVPQPPPVVIQDGQPPAPISIAASVLQAIDPSNNTDSNTGLVTEVTVNPDMRFPLISWTYSLSRVIQNSLYLSSPYASPASLLGYTVIMYTALLFHTDSVHSMTASFAAQHIMNDSVYSQFFNMLLDFPVPDFAHNEFAALMASLPDDIPNLVFLASLAANDFFYDFGRMFPASMFFSLHNLLAGLPGNTATGLLRLHYYITPVFTVNVGANQNVNITPGQLLGRVIGANAHSNWLNERFDSLVNAMAIRAVNQNNMVGSINFPALALADLNNYNPYLFLTSLNHSTHFSVSAAVRNLGPWVTSHLPASRTLRTYLTPGNNSLTETLHFKSVLPTWNTVALTLTSTANPNPLAPGQVGQTPDQVATTTSFLTSPAHPTATDVNGTSVFNIALPRAAAAPPDHPDYALFDTQTNYADPRPDVLNFETFNVTRHLVPDCQIFAPYAPSLASLGPVILSGKLIESHDISGIMLHVPNPGTSLFLENAHHVDGVIRLSRCRSARADSDSPVYVHVTAPPTSNDFSTAFFKAFLSGLRLPLLRLGPARLQPHGTSQVQRFVPGAHLLDQADDTFETMNVFGSSLNNDLNLPASQKFNLWSSYRYIHRTSSTQIVYVYPTLRHIFGTRVQMKASVHPARRVPF